VGRRRAGKQEGFLPKKICRGWQAKTEAQHVSP